MCDDLRRIGRVDHRVDPPPGSRADALSPEQRRVVELLLGGATVAQAAVALHLSGANRGEAPRGCPGGTRGVLDLGGAGDRSTGRRPAEADSRDTG